MKPPPQPEPLLEDVFSESLTPEFNDRLLAETLAQVRQRRNRRRCVQALAAGGLCLGIVLLVLRGHQPGAFLFSSPAQISRPHAAPSWLVRSQPLPASTIVESRAATLEVVTSSRSPLGVVETQVGQKFFTEIGDPELFSLLAGRPVALVRQPGEPAELLFLDPEDRAGFPLP